MHKQDCMQGPKLHNHHIATSSISRYSIVIAFVLLLQTDWSHWSSTFQITLNLTVSWQSNLSWNIFCSVESHSIKLTDPNLLWLHEIKWKVLWAMWCKAVNCLPICVNVNKDMEWSCTLSFPDTPLFVLIELKALPQVKKIILQKLSVSIGFRYTYLLCVFNQPSIIRDAHTDSQQLYHQRKLSSAPLLSSSILGLYYHPSQEDIANTFWITTDCLKANKAFKQQVTWSNRVA